MEPPASPARTAVVRIYRTFATHTTNGVGVGQSAFPQACRALGLDCSRAVARRVFRDFGLTEGAGLTEELFRAAIRRLRQDAGIRSMLRAGGEDEYENEYRTDEEEDTRGRF